MDIAAGISKRKGEYWGSTLIQSLPGTDMNWVRICRPSLNPPDGSNSSNPQETEFLLGCCFMLNRAIRRDFLRRIFWDSVTEACFRMGDSTQHVTDFKNFLWKPLLR